MKGGGSVGDAGGGVRKMLCVWGWGGGKGICCVIGGQLLWGGWVKVGVGGSVRDVGGGTRKMLCVWGGGGGRGICCVIGGHLLWCGWTLL